MKCRREYEAEISRTRDRRMKWWRDARYGMFIHYGIYSVYGKHEWAMAEENWDPEEYAKYVEGFLPKEGCCREWAKMAKEAGMKYMVLTTRHHEGFSLWDSKVNSFNSVNYGPHRDIVREFVDACREYGLKIGFYSTVMEWRHPDSSRCIYESAARRRYQDYLLKLNEELLTNYGKIDILWYDVPEPMESQEGWNSLEMNQRLRELQPDIIINNRSYLPEDFQTPEGKILPADRDWESCMTFNGLSWGYVDSDRVRGYNHTPHQIARMLYLVTKEAGNLLLNVSPRPDGSIPDDVKEPLLKIGKWIERNQGFLYGRKEAKQINYHTTTGMCFEYGENKAYAWNFIWPWDNTIYISGIQTKLTRAYFVATGTEIEFEQDEYRIKLKDLPSDEEDPILGLTIIGLEFDGKIEYPGEGWDRHTTRYGQLNHGYTYCEVKKEREEKGRVDL